MNFCSSCGGYGKVLDPLNSRSQWYHGFSFSKRILLTQAGVYFLLSFVLVSVITILQKEKESSE